MRYDPHVIGELADKMYSEARFLEVFQTILGILVAGGASIPLVPMVNGYWPIIIAGALGGYVGYKLAARAALALRASAQLMLAQVKIEENTRPDNEPRGVAGPSTPSKESRRIANRITGALNP